MAENQDSIIFQRASTSERTVAPILPRRFDVTFNLSCMPDPNTICFVAKLKPDVSVREESATKVNLQEALKQVMKKSTALPCTVSNSFSSNLASIEGLSLAERDFIDSRLMNPVSFVSRFDITAFSFNTTCIYMGQKVGINFAGLLFGIVETFAATVSRIRGDNWVSFDISTAPFIRSALEEILIISPDIRHYRPSVDNVTVESNETKIHVKFQPNFIPHPIDFVFSVYTFKGFVSVLFESNNLAELYKNCFMSDSKDY